MIEVNALSFKYKGASQYALRYVSCCTESSGTTAIVGRSGVGKSTFMALVSGIYTARDEIVGDLEGQIELDGHRPEDIRGPHTISWVPQHPALLDHLTVAENVLLPISITGVTTEATKHCSQILAALDMGEYRSARPRELSGGMQTRVSVARALISRPAYLFLDEPFTGLDVPNRWGLYRMLSGERKGKGLSTFLTTHDIPEALLLADRLLVIGRNEEATTIDIVSNSPADLEGSSMAELLDEARKRAPQIEGLIYSK